MAARWKRGWAAARSWWCQESDHHDELRSPVELAVRLMRDAFMFGVGAIGLVQAPPSIEAFSDRAALVTLGWAAMFVVGTLCSTYGIVRDRPIPEILGCSLIAMAFAMWAVAALVGDDVTWTTRQIACVFGSGAMAQIYRGFVIVKEGKGRGQ